MNYIRTSLPFHKCDLQQNDYRFRFKSFIQVNRVGFFIRRKNNGKMKALGTFQKLTGNEIAADMSTPCKTMR